MKNKFKISVFSLIMISSFGGVSAQTFSGLSYPIAETKNPEKVQAPIDFADLTSARISKGEDRGKEDVSEMRGQAITEIASALGASGGLAKRMAELRSEINTRANELDRLYDFTDPRVHIDNGVLAPVLTEGLANYAQETNDQVRIADKIYKIERSAKFVSVYPTWRTYLQFSYPGYERPHGAYLPKNDAEKRIWDEAVKDGWDKGIMQANRIFEASYSKLERDYLGMIKYKILYSQGLITPTIVAKQNLGVTGGGREMAINDQVFRITDHSALNPNVKDWGVDYPVTNKTDGKLQ